METRMRSIIDSVEYQGLLTELLSNMEVRSENTGLQRAALESILGIVPTVQLEKWISQAKDLVMVRQTQMRLRDNL